MKNKLTNEQKINEFIGKALQMFLSKKASKTLSNLFRRVTQKFKNLYQALKKMHKS